MFGMGMMNNIFGGGSGGIGSSASSSPFANAAGSSAPTIQPAGGRKYNAFMDPDAGGLPGLLGMITGSPTRDQAQGQANGAALGAILQIAQTQGLTFQQAAQKYFTTPEGQDFFINGDMEGFTRDAQMYAASPQSAGTGNFNPLDPEAGVATATMQDYNQLTAEANPTGDPIKQQAYAELAIAGEFSTTPTTTEQERAAGYLVSIGEIDQPMASKIILGQIKVLEMRNLEQTIGWNVVDISGSEGRIGRVLKYIPATTGDLGVEGYGTPDAMAALTAPQVGPLPNEGGVAPIAASGGTPGIGPEANLQLEVNEDATSDAFGTIVGQEVSSEMLRGAGFANYIGANAGGIAGQIWPQLSGQDEASRLTALATIEFDVTQNLTGSRNLQAVQAKFDALFQGGAFTNEIQTAQNLLDIRKSFSRVAQSKFITSQDKRKPDKIRLAAMEDFEALKGALINVPTGSELEAAIEYFKTQPGSIPTALGAARGAIGDALGEPTPESGIPVQRYPDRAAADKGLEAGEWKKGQTIQVGPSIIQTDP